MCGQRYERLELKEVAARGGLLASKNKVRRAAQRKIESAATQLCSKHPDVWNIP